MSIEFYMFLGIFPVILFGYFFVLHSKFWIYALFAYSCMPLRYWTNLSFKLPLFGQMNIDTCFALLFVSLLMLKLFFLELKYKSESFELKEASVYWMFFLALLLSGVAVIILGEPYSVRPMLRWTYASLAFFVIYKDPRLRRPLAVQEAYKFFIGIGSVVSLVLLLQFLAGVDLWRWGGGGTTRFVGLGSISDHAYFMGALTIISYAFFRIKKYGLVYMFFVGLFGIQVLMTLTRGAIFATSLALIAIEFFGMRRKVGARMTMVLVTFACAISTITFYSPLRNRIFASSQSVGSKHLVQDLVSSFEKSGRKESIQFTVDTLRDFGFIIGRGLGAGEHEGKINVGQVAHNEYINIFFDLGAIGLFLYICALIQLFLKTRLKLSAVETISKRIAVATAIGIIVLYSVGALVDNMNSKYKLMTTFLLVSCGFAFSKLPKKIPKKPQNQS